MGMRLAPPARPRRSLVSAASLCFAAGAAAGCSDEGGGETLPDAPMGPCAQGEVFYTGELVDWDAGKGGVNDAAFTVEGEATRTDKTSPNGRFELCLTSAATTRVLIDAPAASTYLDGVAIADLDVLRTGTTASFRDFTALREMQFSPRITLGKAQVFVDVAGTQRAVTLPAAYEAAFAFDGAAWAQGTKGRAVFFVNVEDRSPAITVSMAGNHVGGKTVPLTPNQLTFVTLVGK